MLKSLLSSCVDVPSFVAVLSKPFVCCVLRLLASVAVLLLHGDVSRRRENVGEYSITLPHLFSLLSPTTTHIPTFQLATAVFSSLRTEWVTVIRCCSLQESSHVLRSVCGCYCCPCSCAVRCLNVFLLPALLGLANLLVQL